MYTIHGFRNIKSEQVDIDITQDVTLFYIKIGDVFCFLKKNMFRVNLIKCVNDTSPMSTNVI